MMIESDTSVPSPERKAILILGMHRSGTSAVAGVVNALGVAGPRTLMAADEFNPRGYFESGPLSLAFEEMLASAGSRWHDWRELNLGSLSADAAEQHRTKIKALIRAEFGDNPLIFIKDPRICRFVPFMISILGELNFATVAILPTRNPLHVASSLKRRDNFPPSKSVLLWIRHVLDAERHSRNMQRAFISYPEFLADWRLLVDRASEKTSIVWPRRCNNSEAEIDRFLRPALPHESARCDEVILPKTWLLREVCDVIEEIAAGRETPILLGRLDQLRTKFDEVCDLFGTATAQDELQIEKLRKQADAQHLEIDALHAEVRWRHGEIDRLHKEVGQRDADIRSLHAEVGRRDADIKWLHDEMKRRDSEIQSLHEEAKLRDAEIKRLHDDATPRDRKAEHTSADSNEVLPPEHSRKSDNP